MFQDNEDGLKEAEREARAAAFYEEIKEHPYPKAGVGEVPWAIAFLKFMARIIYDPKEKAFLVYRENLGVWQEIDNASLAWKLLCLSNNNMALQPISERKALAILKHASYYAIKKTRSDASSYL